MQPMKFAPLTAALLLIGVQTGVAEDWARFRGPDGSGISTDSGVPVQWSESKNLRWRAKLPGPGSSSPIVVGDRVFVTCYSGYGVERGGGDISDLKRHLVCLNRADGSIAWSATVAAELPEDPYRGFISEHGYASNTPVSDGRRVFAFFGKTGVLAFDMKGDKLWQVNVGKESSNRRWGSAASLVLYKKTVLVNASEESQSLRALDQATGEEVWKTDASLLDLVYTTPTLVSVDGGRKELVLPVSGEVWGLNPDNGKLRWFCETNQSSNITPTVVASDGVAYVFGGRGAGGVAIRAGGKDDVTDSHIVWTSRTGSYVASPLLHRGHLYWVDDRAIAHCVDAMTGRDVYRERLDVGGGGRPFYASPVLAGEHIYIPSRRDGTIVISANPEFKQVAHNKLAGDDTDFNGTPAISNGELFLRSNRYLYCVSAAE